MKKSYLLLGLLVTGLLHSCTSDSGSDDDEVSDGKKITYEANIKSIITNNCFPCHGNPATDGAPFSLTNYKEVVNAVNTRFLRAAINDSDNPMPKTGLMSQSNRDLIGKWIDQGLKEK